MWPSRIQSRKKTIPNSDALSFLKWSLILLLPLLMDTKKNPTFIAISRAGGPRQLYPYHFVALRGKNLALVTGSSSNPTAGV